MQQGTAYPFLRVLASNVVHPLVGALESCHPTQFATGVWTGTNTGTDTQRAHGPWAHNVRVLA